MKLPRILLVFAVFYGLTTAAMAGTIGGGNNFQMVVVDPSYTTNVITSLSDTFDFAAPCVIPGQLPSGSYDECFTGQNETGEILTSLQMTIGAISGFSPTCADFGGGLDIFTTFNCGTNPDGSYFLDFSGGNITNGEVFTIAEAGVTSGFPDAQASFNTPEPSPALLLTTGLLMGGLFYVDNRRRALATKRS